MALNFFRTFIPNGFGIVFVIVRKCRLGLGFARSDFCNVHLRNCAGARGIGPVLTYHGGEWVSSLEPVSSGSRYCQPLTVRAHYQPFIVDWVIEALARDPLHAMALCPKGPVSAELMMMSLVPAITLAMFRTMSVAFKLFAVTGMLALGVFAFAPGSHAQKAKAQSQPALQAPRVLPKPKPADLRIAQPKRQIEPQRATAPARASPEPLLFLSAEYLQNEKQVEDKLKRVMTICKGC